MVALPGSCVNQDDLDIYIKSVGQGEPVQLTNDPRNEFDPAWSPDGLWIAFSRRSGFSPRADILVIPALGGRERKIPRHRRWWTSARPRAPRNALKWNNIRWSGKFCEPSPARPSRT